METVSLDVSAVMICVCVAVCGLEVGGFDVIQSGRLIIVFHMICFLCGSPLN